MPGNSADRNTNGHHNFSGHIFKLIAVAIARMLYVERAVVAGNTHHPLVLAHVQAVMLGHVAVVTPAPPAGSASGSLW